jgi:hypothetical protein
MANPNPREEPCDTFISKVRAIQWRHVSLFNEYSCELGKAKRRYSTNFQFFLFFLFKLRGRMPP